MAAKLDVKTLGHSGVIIDQNSLEPTLPDDALKSAQNATHDPTQGYGGALRKRPGLKRFNTVSAGGVILGGMPMAVAGTGGAPATGGGGTTGSSAGTGDGTGAPGATSDGGVVVTGNAGGVGAALFNGGATIFSGKKLIVIGRSDNTSSYGAGWYITSKGFADIAKSATTPGPPMNGFSLDRVAGSVDRCCVGQTGSDEGLNARPNGVMFYPGRIDPTTSTTPASIALPTIHRCDGATDAVVATVPVNSGWAMTGSSYTVAHGMQIVGMMTRYGDGGHVYVAVIDRNGTGTTIASNTLRILRLSTTDYSLTEVYNPLATPAPGGVLSAGSPSGAMLSGGGAEAWFGESEQSSSATGRVFSLVDPGSGEFTGSIGYEGSFAAASDVTCMALYKGALFVGHANQAGTPAFAVINGNPLSSTELSQLPGDPQLTASGGTAQTGNFFVSMAVFGGKLYASYYNFTQTAKIYCFDGTNWTTVFTNSGSGDRVPYILRVDPDGDILYAYGSISGSQGRFMTSVDGTTWVDKSSNLSGDLTGSGGGDFSTSRPTTVFMVFAQ